MPPYRVEVQSSAQRDLDRLSGSLFERIAEKLQALTTEPRPAGSQKLTGVKAYRVRVGDYRIIYNVNDDERRVIVTRVRHRREVYRKLR